MLNDQDGLNSVLILVPVWNGQSALDFTLGSLLGTDAENALVLVVDDGSDEPITSLGQLNKIRVERLSQNVGIASALNAGLNVARHLGVKYALRLDAGDGYVDGRISKQIAFMEANPTVAVLGTAAEYFYPNANRRTVYYPPTDHQSIVQRLRYHNPIVHPSIILRMEAIGAGYSTAYPASEDYELYLRLCREWRLANLSDCLCRYEVNTGSISALRRSQQLANGIRLKLRHFDLSEPHCYLGLMENTLRYIMPASISRGLRRLRPGKMPSRS